MGLIWSLFRRFPRIFHLLPGYEFGASILRNLFKALTLTYCLNYTSVTETLDQNPDDHLYVRDWAKPGESSFWRNPRPSGNSAFLRLSGGVRLSLIHFATSAFIASRRRVQPEPYLALSQRGGEPVCPGIIRSIRHPRTGGVGRLLRRETHFEKGGVAAQPQFDSPDSSRTGLRSPAVGRHDDTSASIQGDECRSCLPVVQVETRISPTVLLD